MTDNTPTPVSKPRKPYIFVWAGESYYSALTATSVREARKTLLQSPDAEAIHGHIATEEPRIYADMIEWFLDIPESALWIIQDPTPLIQRLDDEILLRMLDQLKESNADSIDTLQFQTMLRKLLDEKSENES